MSRTVTLAWENDMDRTTSDYISRTSTGRSIINNSHVGIYEPTWCTTDKDLVKVKKIIFNPPATIVIWKDGHKEVVKCNNHEEFEPEVGVAMAFIKRIFESRNQFTKLVDDAWLDYYEEYLKTISEEYLKTVRYGTERIENPGTTVRKNNND